VQCRAFLDLICCPGPFVSPFTRQAQREATGKLSRSTQSILAPGLQYEDTIEWCGRLPQAWKARSPSPADPGRQHTGFRAPTLVVNLANGAERLQINSTLRAACSARSTRILTSTRVDPFLKIFCLLVMPTPRFSKNSANAPATAV
jgi:hypothetical protein